MYFSLVIAYLHLFTRALLTVLFANVLRELELHSIANTRILTRRRRAFYRAAFKLICLSTADSISLFSPFSVSPRLVKLCYAKVRDLKTFLKVRRFLLLNTTLS